MVVSNMRRLRNCIFLLLMGLAIVVSCAERESVTANREIRGLPPISTIDAVAANDGTLVFTVNHEIAFYSAKLPGYSEGLSQEESYQSIVLFDVENAKQGLLTVDTPVHIAFQGYRYVAVGGDYLVIGRTSPEPTVYTYRVDEVLNSLSDMRTRAVWFIDGGFRALIAPKRTKGKWSIAQFRASFNETSQPLVSEGIQIREPPPEVLLAGCDVDSNVMVLHATVGPGNEAWRGTVSELQVLSIDAFTGETELVASVDVAKENIGVALVEFSSCELQVIGDDIFGICGPLVLRFGSERSDYVRLPWRKMRTRYCLDSTRMAVVGLSYTREGATSLQVETLALSRPLGQ